jgi:hypothetical protein
LHQIEPLKRRLRLFLLIVSLLRAFLANDKSDKATGTSPCQPVLRTSMKSGKPVLQPSETIYIFM